MKLCKPAAINLVLSLLGIIVYSCVIGFSKLQYGDKFAMILLTAFFSLIGTIFWTFIIQLFCRSGLKIISWIMVTIAILSISSSIFFNLFVIFSEIKGGEGLGNRVNGDTTTSVVATTNPVSVSSFDAAAFQFQ
jgi:ABC-type multidrug transport system permease subunit